MKAFCVLAKGHDPRENLALEEYIIENCGQGEVWLYLWCNHNTVVIGRNQNPWRECDMDAIKKDGVTLVRRQSGGGAVFHDDGNLNFTFIADKSLYNLEKQLGVVIKALESFGLKAEFSGRNDILLDGKKFSGNAFSHKSDISMQHGTLLISSDMTKLSRYLSPSKAKLEAKGVKSVRSRVCNLSEYSANITLDKMAEALKDAFEKEYKKLDKVIYSDDFNTESYLHLIQKYSSWEWTVGETPQYEMTFETRFGWGEVQLLINVKNGCIQNAAIYSDAMNAGFITVAGEGLAGVIARGDCVVAALNQAFTRLEQELGSQAIDPNQQNELCAWISSVL